MLTILCQLIKPIRRTGLDSPCIFAIFCMKKLTGIPYVGNQRIVMSTYLVYSGLLYYLLLRARFCFFFRDLRAPPKAPPAMEHMAVLRESPPNRLPEGTQADRSLSRSR